MKKTFLSLATALLAVSAIAQNGFNFFEVPKTIVVTTPQVLAGTYSNAPVDLHGSVGIAKLDFNIVSNASSGALVVTLCQSDDTTNWTAVPNIAQATLSSVTATNNSYGSTLKSTNSFLFAGTVTTPTAATAGWATPYLSPAAFNYTGSISNMSATGAYSVGVNVQNVKRYINVLYTGSSGHTVGAILTVRRDYLQ